MYKVGDCSILFSDVNKVEYVNSMKKHDRASKMLHSYNPRAEEHICEPTAVNHPSESRYGQLGAIRKEFMISDDFQVRALNAKERAHLSLKG